MINLNKIAGVDLSITDDWKLIFGEPMSSVRESVRQIDSLSAVWMDPTVHGKEDVYRVYWGAYRVADHAIFRRHGLDHAYVIILPGCYGQEYAKTQGHYHPPVTGKDVSTPELYKVLHGHGCFLLQRSLSPYSKVDDVVLIDVSPGDVFHIAPGYGHLTVNWGDEPLVFEAFLTADLTATTEPYRARRGGTHYIIRNGERAEVVPNKHYEYLPLLRRCQSSDLQRWEEIWGDLLYTQVVHHPGDFVFLSEPSQFDTAWSL